MTHRLGGTTTMSKRLAGKDGFTGFTFMPLGVYLLKPGESHALWQVIDAITLATVWQWSHRYTRDRWSIVQDDWQVEEKAATAGWTVEQVISVGPGWGYVYRLLEKCEMATVCGREGEETGGDVSKHVRWNLEMRFLLTRRRRNECFSEAKRRRVDLGWDEEKRMWEGEGEGERSLLHSQLCR